MHLGWVCAYVYTGAFRSQKVLDLLGQVVERCVMWVLETDLGFSTIATLALNHGSILQG